MNQLRTHRFDPVRDALASYTPPPPKVLAPPQPITSIDVRHVSLINPFMHNPCISPLCEELIDTGNPIAFTLHMHLKHYHDLADRGRHPRKHSGEGDDSETEDEHDQEGSMPCLDPKCESVVADEQRLYDHIKDVHWKLDMHACPACEQVVGGHETGLKKHIWTDHAGVQVLSGGCPISEVENEEYTKNEE